MDLHGTVSGAIQAVNPFVPGTIQSSTGYTANDDGSRTPTYSTAVVSCQVQAMSFKDLQQVDGLNLNGTRRSIYVKGAQNGVVRVSSKGGDLITLTDGPNAGVYLVAMVLEQWPDWVKVAVTLQNGA